MIGMAQISLALTNAMVGACIHLVARPYSPRRLFSVPLGRELDEADRARARRFLVLNAAFWAIGVIGALFATEVWSFVVLSLAPSFVPITVLGVEMARVLKSRAPEAIPGRFAVPLEAPPPASSYASAPLQIANLAVPLLAAAAFLFVRGMLPARIPLHWNVRGEIDRWGRPDELWLFAGFALFDLLLLWFTVRSVARERWALPPRDAERYLALQRVRRGLLVRLVEWLILAVNGGLCLLWLSIAVGSIPGNGSLVAVGVVASLALMSTGTLVILGLFMGRFTEVQDELRAIAGTDALGTRPAGWRWGGLVYYAPDDPAVIVPKRFGMGQTVNFARPSAWFFLIFVTVAPVLLALGAVALSK